MIKLLKKTFALFISLFLIGIVFVFLILLYFANDLPNYKILEKYQPPISSRVHAGDGQLIAEYALQKRLFIPYDSIPNNVIHSFLSAEDKNFFKHPGIDAKGVLRAAIKNVKNLMNTRRLEGASTITQQVAKNFLLTNEVSYTRKIKEAILAFRIERAFSKERIMELYLNQIYLGHGTYGIAAASLEYFDKAVNELNYQEAALLAALPKAPSKYDPYKSINLATKRRNLVIKNLFDNSYISEDIYQNLIDKKIVLKKRNIKLLKEANFYSEEVRRIISDKYGYDKLYKGGLSIKTPLNPEYQIQSFNSLRKGLQLYDKRHGWRGPLTNKKNIKNWVAQVNQYKIDKDINWKLAQVKTVEDLKATIETESLETGYLNFEELHWTRKKTVKEILKEGDIIYVKKIKNNIWELKQLPKVNGAVVIIDPYTGRVLSLVGGFSYELSEFNRATQAKRQPGSAFKPFVYAAALENGFTPSSLVLDAPFVADQGEGKKLWKPENYGKKFYGPSTLRKGIEKSRNLMTVRVAQNLGLGKILKTANKFDIYGDVPEVLSISLGAAETTLLKLTTAYSTFANGGKKVESILIDRIQDRRGKTIYNADKRKCLGCNNISHLDKKIPMIKDNLKQIISPTTAYQITSMLEGAIKRGTGRKLRDLNLPLAGKTGTTNNNMDTWFIGFTSKIVIGVYVGFDDPESLGKYETGAKVALPIFKDILINIIKKKDTFPFKIPEGITLVMVDEKNGLPANKYSKKIIYESFKSSNVKNGDLKMIFSKEKNIYNDSSKEQILKFY